MAGNQPKCLLFVRLTLLRLELALTLIFLFENVIFFGNSNGDCFGGSRTVCDLNGYLKLNAQCNDQNRQRVSPNEQ